MIHSTQTLYFDVGLEWTSHCLYVSLIDSQMKKDFSTKTRFHREVRSFYTTKEHISYTYYGIWLCKWCSRWIPPDGWNHGEFILKNFVDGVIYLFGEDYLRRLTVEDLQWLLEIGEMRIFPGTIGCIDCMHWKWNNCPTAWKLQYSRESGKPTIVLEAIASHDLWIWHAFFRPPGILQNINVLDHSPIFDDILQVQAPKVNYFVNGHQYHMG